MRGRGSLVSNTHTDARASEYNTVSKCQSEFSTAAQRDEGEYIYVYIIHFVSRRWKWKISIKKFFLFG